jgi:hypothetical protein
MKKFLLILLVAFSVILLAAWTDTMDVDAAIADPLVVTVTDYYVKGDNDFTDAIIRADYRLKSAGGGILLFPSGNYRIRPGRIHIPSGVKWLGQGSARIYTKETSLYNIAIATESGAKNIIIENLIFDQRDDDAAVPRSASHLGAFILHIYGTDNVEVSGCTFYTYGTCAVLSQSSYDQPVNIIKIHNNKAYFQRKVDTFYDVSVFNIDGRKVYVEDNHIEGIEVSSYRYSRPRTAIEVHMPSGIVSGNTTKNTEIGVLQLNWPSLWNTYEASYVGNIQISDNEISNAIIGIDVWSASTLASAVTRNLSILRNNIELLLSSNSFPAKGISLSDGDKSDSRFVNVLIEGNNILMTVEPGIQSARDRLYYLIPGDNTGAMFMNVRSTIDTLVIRDNNVYNFPYSFLNLYRKNNTGESFMHNNIKVYDNTITECSYATPYPGMFKAVFNIGYATGVSVYNNVIINRSTVILDRLNELDGVDSLEFTDNIFIGGSETYPGDGTGSGQNIVFMIGLPIMKINSELKEIDAGRGTVPLIIDNRVLIPARALIEAFGGNITLGDDGKKITMIHNDKTVVLWIGSIRTLVNGEEKTLDIAPVVINDRVMIPLRFIAENLDYNVKWDYLNKEVTIRVDKN